MPAYAKTMRRSTRRRVIPGSVTPNPRVLFGPVFGALGTLDSPPFNWDPGALVAVIIDATGGATGEALNSFSATNWTGSAWTIVGFTTVTASKVSVWIAYAVAGPTAQTAPSVGTATFAGASTDNQMIGVQFSGQDPTTPVDVSASVFAGDATTTTTPALTLGVAPLLVDWVLSAYASRNNQPLPGSTGFSSLSKGFAHANPMVPALVQVRTGSTSTAVDAQGMGTAANAGVAVVIKAASTGGPVSQNATGQGDALVDAAGTSASSILASSAATATAASTATSSVTDSSAGAGAAVSNAAGVATVQSSTSGAATATANGSGAGVIATPGASTPSALASASGTGTPRVVAAAAAAATATSAGVATPNTIGAGSGSAIATASGATTARVAAAATATALANGSGASIVSDSPTGSATATASGAGSAVPAGSVTGSASATATAAGTCTTQANAAGAGGANATAAGQCATRVAAAASASAATSSGGVSFARLNSAGAATAFGAATALAALNVLASATADALAVATGSASTAGAIVIATPPSRTGVIPPSTGRGSTVSGGTRVLVIPRTVKAPITGTTRVLIIQPSDRTVTP